MDIILVFVLNFQLTFVCQQYTLLVIERLSIVEKFPCSGVILLTHLSVYSRIFQSIQDVYVTVKQHGRLNMCTSSSTQALSSGQRPISYTAHERL